MESNLTEKTRETPKQPRNLTALEETKNSPFASHWTPDKDGHLKSARNWIGEFDPEIQKEFNPSIRNNFISNRAEIFQLLNIKKFSEIQEIIVDKKRREGLSERVYELLGNKYGIEGSRTEVIAQINGYGQYADSVINYLRGETHPLSNFSTKLEMINDVAAADNPLDLILMYFDESFADRARFEAKRKLILMDLAADIHKREKKEQNKANFKKFDDFISDRVLSQDVKKGETETAYILSEHDPDTFGCTSFQILNEKVSTVHGQKLTEVRRRKFEIDGKTIPIKIETREKSIASKILKAIRKDEVNTGHAVDDDLGFFGVLNSYSDVKKFENRLRQAANEIGSSLGFEEIQDTLMGGAFETTNTGSSPEIKIKKEFAKMGGMRPDLVLHTINTYLDYSYKRGEAHDEYEVNRLFDTGAIELLFPKLRYGIDWKEERHGILKQVRERLEK